MKRTKLSTAITSVVCGSMSCMQAHATDVDITTMVFGGTYAATGQLRDDTDDFGLMQSVDPFYGNPWSAVGVAYFEAGNTSPIVDDDTVSDEADVTNSANPTAWGALTQTVAESGGTYTWAGTAVQGTFSYTFTLPADHVAWGTLFNWNGNQGIPVLNIMDCTDPNNCSGIGTPMQTGPFLGAAPVFAGGQAPLQCQDIFTFTPPETPVEINFAEAAAEACGNVLGALSLVSVGDAEFGTVANDGGTVTYTPGENFQGPDTFTYEATDGTNNSSANFIMQVGGELQNNFTMLDSGGGIIGGTNDVEFEWNEVFNDGALDADGVPTDTTYGNATLNSDYPFFGFVWTAHHLRLFQGPGTFKFDVTCTAADYDAGDVNCDRPLDEQGVEGGSRFVEVTLEEGQVAAHMLFDWNTSSDIDVVNVWVPNEKWTNEVIGDGVNELYANDAGVPPANDATFDFVSIDADGDGINGVPMIDGAFVGSNANFNIGPDRPAITTPYTDQISDVSTGSFATSIWTLFTGVLGLFGLRRIIYSKHH